MTQPTNLLTFIEITCLRCYGFGWIIDRFDHGKRERCGCQVKAAQTPIQGQCPCLLAKKGSQKNDN